MGAQWKHAGRVENAAKKGVLFSKLVKEIVVSAKLGDPNPDNNYRLRAAVEAARAQSVPRDTIERAIKKGAGLLEPIHYELVTYEGFAPHQVPVIVECLTDNKNRTASKIRELFRKGQLGSIGSVAWMFDRLGLIEATHSNAKLDIETIAIEAGAQNVEPMEKTEISGNSIGARFYTSINDLSLVAQYLNQEKWNVTLAELSYQAKNTLQLAEDLQKEVISFLSQIEDFDDVHRIYTALS